MRTMVATARAKIGCSRCGSGALRANQGQYDTLCLTCGATFTAARTGRPLQRSALVQAGVEEATTYARDARKALGTSEASVISYAGLWLLLASLAPVAARDIVDLGLARPDARAAALALLDDPHPTIGSAVAGWLKPGVTPTRPLPLPLEPLPSQRRLDEWADEHTRGLIRAFPLTLDPDVLLVLASALVITPRWRKPLQREKSGLLLLDGGVQALVETKAAGVVAVAKPYTDDGVDVISVIAAPSVAPEDVWRGVDEVMARFAAGEIGFGDHPGDLADGHAWRVGYVRERVPSHAPAERWRSHLPSWSVEADHRELLQAPAVAPIAAGIAAAFDEDDVEVACVQRAMAAYDEFGFTAAAVTAVGALAAAAPRLEERLIRTVDITFDRPHAVVAVARGGAWDGLPLFHCWVTP